MTTMTTTTPSAPVGDYQGSHATQHEAAAHCSRLIGGGIYQEQDGRWHVWSTSNPEEAAAQSADQLAAIAGRKAAEALDAYAAALDHAATVALDNGNSRDATARRMAATQARDFAAAARKAAARLS